MAECITNLDWFDFTESDWDTFIADEWDTFDAYPSQATDFIQPSGVYASIRNTGDRLWSNLQNVLLDDGQFATCECENNEFTQAIFCNFDWSTIINPEDAILGLQIYIDAKTDSGAVSGSVFFDRQIQLFLESEPFGLNKFKAATGDPVEEPNWNVSQKINLYGECGDLFGMEYISPDQLLTDDLGCMIRFARNGTSPRIFELQTVKMRVWKEDFADVPPEYDSRLAVATTQFTNRNDSDGGTEIIRFPKGFGKPEAILFYSVLEKQTGNRDSISFTGIGIAAAKGREAAHSNQQYDLTIGGSNRLTTEGSLALSFHEPYECPQIASVENEKVTITNFAWTIPSGKVFTDTHAIAINGDCVEAYCDLLNGVESGNEKIVDTGFRTELLHIFNGMEIYGREGNHAHNGYCGDGDGAVNIVGQNIEQWDVSYTRRGGNAGATFGETDTRFMSGRCKTNKNVGEQSGIPETYWWEAKDFTATSFTIAGKGDPGAGLEPPGMNDGGAIAAFSFKGNCGGRSGYFALPTTVGVHDIIIGPGTPYVALLSGSLAPVLDFEYDNNILGECYTRGVFTNKRDFSYSALLKTNSAPLECKTKIGTNYTLYDGDGNIRFDAEVVLIPTGLSFNVLQTDGVAYLVLYTLIGTKLGSVNFWFDQLFNNHIQAIHGPHVKE